MFGRQWKKRILALTMAVTMAGTSADLTVFAASGEQYAEAAQQETGVILSETGTDGHLLPFIAGTMEEVLAAKEDGDTEYYYEESTIDLGDIYTTAPEEEDDIFSFSLADGNVELIDGTAEEWIDRLKLTEEESVIRSFYDTLVEASDNDGVDDRLIEDSYFAQDASIQLGEATGTAASLDAVRSACIAVRDRYSKYARAALDAFDRDHPEVFWLSGRSSTSVGYRYSPSDEGYSYTATVTFLLKNTSSDFDIRDEKYRSESVIKSSISAMETQANGLLGAVQGKTDVEKITYFNERLTKMNEYNTSSNLNNIDHDCRECVSALEGRIGTEGPVCEAYARAFKVLCDRSGIPCVLVDGSARSSASAAGGGHMWNYVQAAGKWYGMDVTWNDPMVAGRSGAVSGYETDRWSLVGSQTVVGSGGLKFIESHPVSNTASVGGLGFTNGPEIEDSVYVSGMTEYGQETAAGNCGEVKWAVYDSTASGSSTGDTLVISGEGVMADYASLSAAPWYTYASDIKKIVVKDGVKGIGSHAFNGMSSVTAVTMPENLTSIGQYAFAGLTAAAGLKVPMTLTSLGEGAFQGCTKVTDVSIPSGITTLEKKVFNGCTGLTEILIPATVAEIREDAFSGTGLKKVYVEKRSNAVTGTAGFRGMDSTVVYFASTPITEFADVTVKAPYTISYTKNGTVKNIEQVYADDTAEYTFKSADLPETVGEWYIPNYKNTGKKIVKARTRLENINSDISVLLMPMVITGQPQDTAVAYGYTLAPDLRVEIIKDPDVQIDYQWYRKVTVNNSTSLIVMEGENEPAMTIPAGLNKGTYTYLCQLSYEGRSFYSEEAVVTVGAADFSKAKVTVAGTYTYEGTEIIPKISDITVTLNDRKISSEVYEITDVADNVDAGTAEITLTAKAGSDYAGSASGNFTILPMTIEAADAELAPKVYDGTKEAEVEAVLFKQQGTDRNIVLDIQTDYTASASFTDAGAGSTKTAVVEIRLKEDVKNYTLAENTLTVDGKEIEKAEAPQAEDVTLEYTHKQKHEVRMDLEELLPELGENKTWGNITYEAKAEPEGFLEEAPKVTDHILEYTVKEGLAGDTADLTVTVKSDNYADFSITLCLELTRQTKVVLKKGSLVSVGDRKLTYGDILSELMFEDAEFVEAETDNKVEGTLTWKEPDQILRAGIRKAEWVFEPDDPEYLPVEGETEVVVVPKKITVTIENADRKYGEEDPEFSFIISQGELVGDDTGEAIGMKLGTKAVALSPVGEYAITGVAEGEDYDVTVVPGTLTIEQAEGILEIPQGKESYAKIFGDGEFAIEVLTNVPENLVYEVVDGCGPDGNEKDAEEILTVDAQGVAKIWGTGTVTVRCSLTESHNYTAAGPADVTVSVERCMEFMIEEISDRTYTGKAIRPEPRIFDGENERILTKGKDYTITYKNNVNASEDVEDETKLPTVIIKGKGNYSSQVSINFTILKKDIGEEDVAAPDIYSVVSSKAQKKVPAVTYNGKKLKNGRDIRVEWTESEGDYRDSGDYPIYVEGIGNYTGEREITLSLREKQYMISNAKVKKIQTQNLADYNTAVILDNKTLVVTAVIGHETRTLVENEDFVTEYENNDRVGTASVTIRGIGDLFRGTKKITFKVKGISLAAATISPIPDQVWEGTKAEPEITVTSSEGVNLIEGIDYVLTYTKNEKAGNAAAVVKGIGKYSGTLKKKFVILPYDLNGETNAEGELKEDSLLRETGGLLETADGDIAVKFMKGGSKIQTEFYFNDRLMTAGKDYTVSYKNNKKPYGLTPAEEEYDSGKAPVIVVKGKGNFKGTIEKRFVIEPKSLEEGVTFTVENKPFSSKAGNYISKPVLTDEDGKKLVEGKDYTKPVYSLDGEELKKNAKVEAGSEITVTVTGLGGYLEEEYSAVYQITEKNFGKAKAADITKVYTGRKITLTEEDFYDGEGKSKITLQGEELIYGVDFEIVEGSYRKNEKKGTASVTLRGCSEYGGTKTIKFKILSKDLEFEK